VPTVRCTWGQRACLVYILYVSILTVEIVIRKNVLKDSKMKEIMKEIEQNEDNLIVDDRGFAKFDRWFPPSGNKLIKIAEDMIFAEDIMSEVEKIRDLAWRWFVTSTNTGFEVQVTKYHLSPEYRYGWHTDNIADLDEKLRILNYIFYLNDDFEGGELQLSKSLNRKSFNDIQEFPVAFTIKPEKNMLVMIPSWILHRVLPVTSGSSRLTLNGHVTKN